MERREHGPGIRIVLLMMRGEMRQGDGRGVELRKIRRSSERGGGGMNLCFTNWIEEVDSRSS